MPDPIPTRIVREIGDAIGTLPRVGPEYVLEIDPIMAQAGRSREWVQRIRAGEQAGKYAAEIDVGPASQVLSEGEGGRKTFGVEQFDMPVVITFHLPNPLPVDQTPAQAAALIFADVFALCSPITAVAPQVQCGRWYEFAGGAGSGEPLATYTDVVGGGGVALSDVDSRVTVVGLMIRFRCRSGDLGVRA